MIDRLIYFESDRFRALPEEMDENSDDCVFNEGTYGKALGDFLTASLIEFGYTLKFACTEDWGRYYEFDHDDPYALAFGCTMFEDGHLVQFMPKKPYVRRFLKKYHAEPKIEKLHDAI